MRKHLLTILIVFCSAQMVFPQEDDGVVALDLPARNSLVFNRYVINPTFSFVRQQDKYFSINNKREWVQFENSPETYLASFSGRFAENIGAGIAVFQQNYGVLTTFGGLLNFAYNIKINQVSNLTFGLNVGAYKSGINTSNIATNFDDPSLQNVTSNFLLTINPGINYGTEFLDFGISVNNLVLYNFESSMLIEDNPKQGIQAHVMHTGYFNSRGFFSDTKFTTLLRSEFRPDETIISGLAMLNVPKGLWLQVGYNNIYGVSGGLGINLTKQIALEYNIEKSIGELVEFGSSHEITLAYRFISKKDYKNNDDAEISGLFSKKRNNAVKLSEAELEGIRSRAAERKAQAKLDIDIDIDKKAAVEAEAQANLDAKAKAKEEAEIEAKLLKEKIAKEAAEFEIQEKLEADKKAKERADTRTRLLIEEKAREKTEAKVKQLAEQKAKQAADAQVIILAEQKAKQAADAQAILLAEQKAKQVADAQAKLLAEQKAKQAADAQAILLAEQKAKQVADAQAILLTERKAKEAADAQAILLAEQKAKQAADAQAKLLAEQKAKQAADAQAKLLAEQKAKEVADAQAILLAEQKAKQVADAEAKLLAEQKAKEAADAQTTLLVEQKAKEVAAAQAILFAEQKAKEATDAEAKEDLIANPKDDLGQSMKEAAKLAEDSQTEQNELLKQFDDIIKIKDKDLKDLKEENDLSDQGIAVKPRPFKSITAENNALNEIKADLSTLIKSRNDEIEKLKTLYDERIKNTELDDVTLFYKNKIKRLSDEQLKAVQTNAQLDTQLENIRIATEIEKRRRIKRAAFDNEDDRYAQDREMLQNIKRTTILSEKPFKSEDFDFGQKQGSTIQILKNVKNVESGYYLIIAVHNNITKRNDFVRKVISSGRTNVDFFYDVNTSNYYIYYDKYDSINSANDAMGSKGDRPYNINMSLMKIEN
jgi:type IX secretion system PorP/SprF family membrane protein